MWLAWSDVATGGLFTIVGVIIGLIGGAMVEYGLERRRGRQRIRQAKRLIAGELLRVLIHLKSLVESRSYPKSIGEGLAGGRFLPDSVWIEYRPALALLEEDADTYELVATVLDTIATTRELVGRGAANTPLPGELLEVITENFELTKSAYALLMGKPAPVS